jgi:hypothetical protein
MFRWTAKMMASADTYVRKALGLPDLPRWMWKYTSPELRAELERQARERKPFWRRERKRTPRPLAEHPSRKARQRAPRPVQVRVRKPQPVPDRSLGYRARRTQAASQSARARTGRGTR